MQRSGIFCRHLAFRRAANRDHSENECSLCLTLCFVRRQTNCAQRDWQQLAVEGFCDCCEQDSASGRTGRF